MQNRLNHCSKPFFSEQSLNHLNFPKVNIFFLKKISFFMVEKNPKKPQQQQKQKPVKFSKDVVEEISNVFFNVHFLEPKLTILTNRRSFFKNAKTVSILICFLYCSFHLYNDRKSQKSKVWTLPWDLIQKSISGCGTKYSRQLFITEKYFCSWHGCCCY